MTLDTDGFSEDDFFYDGGDWVNDIHEMYTDFGLSAVDGFTSQQLNDYLKFRISLLAEETKETQDAFAAQDPEGIVDGLIDACVIAIGTLEVFGVDAYEAWDRVHAANSAKEVGIKPGRPNPFGLPDLVKPEGWTGPSHEDNHGILPKAFPKEI